jgi:hypothetical protein
LSEYLDGSSLAEYASLERARPAAEVPDAAAGPIGAAELAAAAAAAGADDWTPAPASQPAPIDHEARRAEWDRAKRDRQKLADASFAAKLKKSKKRAAELDEAKAELAREFAELGPVDEASTPPPPAELFRTALEAATGTVDILDPPSGPAPRPRPRARKQKRIAYALQNQRRTRGDRAERTRDEAERAKRNAEHVSRHRAKFLKRYGRDEAPPTIPRELWIKCQLIREDKRSCEYYLSLVESNPTWVGAVRNSARVPLQDGTTRYTFYDQRARCIAAIAVAIRELGHDMPSGRGAFDRLTRGINRCALALLVRDPAGTDPLCDHCKNNHPSFSALTGMHRPDGTLENGQIGWVRALVAGGAIDVPHQFKHPVAIEKCCKQWEIGEAGYPCNWYWSLGPHFNPLDFTDAELAHYEALRELGACILEDATPRRVSYLRPESERPPPPS